MPNNKSKNLLILNFRKDSFEINQSNGRSMDE